MSHDPSLSKGNTYTVDFDSALGTAIHNYIERCRMANEAADEFVRRLHLEFRFPELSPEDILHFSDDCDAGGLLYISIANDRLGKLKTSPDYVMWASLADPDDDQRTIWFPRMEVRTQYVRFGQAVKLFRSGCKSWEFQTEPKHPQSVKAFNYGDIVKRISPDNRRALYDAKGNEPSHATRVAIGCHYYLPTDEGHGSFATPDADFDRAFGLYKAWTALPRVSANTLSRILALEMPANLSGSSRKDGRHLAEELTKISFCHWQTDTENHRYIINTGLVSHLNDMHLVGQS